MHELLLHAKTHARIASALAPFENQLRVTEFHDDGSFRLPGSAEPVTEIDPSIVYANTDSFFSPAVADYMVSLLKAENIQWFQSSAAGIEHPVLQSIGQKVGLYTNSHAQCEAIGEWVFGNVLDCLQKGHERRRAQLEKNWKRLQWREVSDTRWLIFGYGTIGEATARRVKALGGDVTAVKRRQTDVAHADRVIGPDQLLNALPDADVVVMCAPLTTETQHIANEAFFAAIKPGAIYVNVGRGGLNDEAALLSALDAGRVSQAVLDVFETEPLPDDSPFWTHDRVTVSAHTSAVTAGSQRRTDQVFVDNLAKFLAGEPLSNLVAKSAFDDAPL